MATANYRVEIKVPDEAFLPTDEEITKWLITFLPEEGSSVTTHETSTLRVEGRQGPTGSWYYVEIAKNGEVTATSEMYTRKEDAEEQGRNKAEDLGVPFIWEPVK